MSFKRMMKFPVISSTSEVIPFSGSDPMAIIQEYPQAGLLSARMPSGRTTLKFSDFDYAGQRYTISWIHG